LPAASPEPPPPAHGFLENVGSRLDTFANLEKLEGFSLRAMFSEVFKRRRPAEVDDWFLVGSYCTTPALEEIQTDWPRPWFFARVFAFMALSYAGLQLAHTLFPDVINLLPGILFTGTFAVPLAMAFLFFELNTPRNVSFHKVLMLICAGGVLSLCFALGVNQMAGLGALGPAAAGITEETGKLLAVLVIMRAPKYRYILNGLLFGAAVGAGFAAFESAGYAFQALLGRNGVEGMVQSIYLRAAITPFAHIAWTAISAGALWRAKLKNRSWAAALGDRSFLKMMAIPVTLHGLWDLSPVGLLRDLPLAGLFEILKQGAIGLVGWYVVFGLMQQGLRQIKSVPASKPAANPITAG